MSPKLTFILATEIMFAAVVAASLYLWLGTGSPAHDTEVNEFASQPGDSPEQLLVRFREAWEARDFERLITLFHWEGVDRFTSDTVRQSVITDLRLPLQDVVFLPPDPEGITQYEVHGILYRPNLEVVGRLQAVFTESDGESPSSTTYLVGSYEGQYRLCLAAPAPAG